MRGRLITALWALVALFMVRVLGQALQRWMALPFFPPFDDFQGSNLPYEILLTTQILILGVMVWTILRIQRGVLLPNYRAGRILLCLGGIYMTGSVLRIVVGLSVPDVHEWFRAWIPAFFHLILAAFVLLAALYHLSVFTEEKI